AIEAAKGIESFVMQAMDYIIQVFGLFLFQFFDECSGFLPIFVCKKFKFFGRFVFHILHYATSSIIMIFSLRGLPLRACARNNPEITTRIPRIFCSPSSSFKTIKERMATNTGMRFTKVLERFTPICLILWVKNTKASVEAKTASNTMARNAC